MLQKILDFMVAKIQIASISLPIWALLVAAAAVILILCVILACLNKKRVTPKEKLSASDIIRDEQNNTDIGFKSGALPVPTPVASETLPAPAEYHDSVLAAQAQEAERKIAPAAIVKNNEAGQDDPILPPTEEPKRKTEEPKRKKTEPVKQAEPVQEAHPEPKLEKIDPILEEKSAPAAPAPTEEPEVREIAAAQDVLAEDESANVIVPPVKKKPPVRSQPRQSAPPQPVRLTSAYEQASERKRPVKQTKPAAPKKQPPRKEFVAPTIGNNGSLNATFAGNSQLIDVDGQKVTAIKLFGDKIEPTRGKYVVVRDAANDARPFRFQLRANNGQVLFISEGYKIRPRARQIETFRKAVETGTFSYEQNKTGHFQFKLYTSDGKLFGMSDLYRSRDGAENAVQSVQYFALQANYIEDGTILPE